MRGGSWGALSMRASICLRSSLVSCVTQTSAEATAAVPAAKSPLLPLPSMAGSVSWRTD